MPMTLSGTTGIALPSGAAPAFSAYPSATTSMSSGTWTKVTFQTEVFDTNSNYDATNSKFQPTIAGYYQISCSVAVANNCQSQVGFYKTGSVFMYGGYQGATSNYGATLSGLIYLNGSTDYVEVYFYTGATGNSSVTNQRDTWFTGVFVRSA